MRKGEEQPSSQIPRAGLTHPIYPSHSAVYVDPKNGSWTYNSRLVQQPEQPGPSSHGHNSINNEARVPWPQGTRVNASTNTTADRWHEQRSTSNQCEYNVWVPQPQGIIKQGIISGSDGRLAIAVGVQHTPDLICSSTTRLYNTGKHVPRSSSHPSVPNNSCGPQSLPSYPNNASPYNISLRNSVDYNIVGGSGQDRERRPRPHSQPVGSCDILHPDQDVVHKQYAIMPHICEFSSNQISSNQYASSSSKSARSTPQLGR